MEFSNIFVDQKNEIVKVFTTAFTNSEGPKEGVIIGNFVCDLLKTTASEDLYVFTALENEEIIGAAIFTRLIFSKDSRSVFILSPMAVKTEKQGKGVGQNLLNYALNFLEKCNVDVVITYGDPAYYGKVGFNPVTEAEVPAPMKLSRTEGWIAQSLSDKKLEPLLDACTCVPALNNQGLW